METCNERAKQSATAIINWCLDVDIQDAEQDPNFVTSEVMRAMKWQKQKDIDKACELVNRMFATRPFSTTEKQQRIIIEAFRNAMEE